jgi:hypothetical protein
MNLPLLPTPPTENLYKFAAITGVILCILAPLYWASFYVAYRHQELAALQSLHDAVASEDFSVLKATDQTAKTMTTEEKQLVEHSNSAKQRAQSTGADYLLMARFFNVVNVIAVTFEIAGLFVTFWGFNRWYRRVQEPLDRILQKQARDFVALKSEVENPS